MTSDLQHGCRCSDLQAQLPQDVADAERCAWQAGADDVEVSDTWGDVPVTNEELSAIEQYLAGQLTDIFAAIHRREIRNTNLGTV